MGMCQYIPGSDNSYICPSKSTFSNGGTLLSLDGGANWIDIDDEVLYGVEFVSETEGWAGSLTPSPEQGMFKWEGYTPLSVETHAVRELDLYPSMASNRITISNFNGILPAQIQLIDMTGKSISKSIGQATVDVSDLSPGIYHLVFDVEGQSYRGRFVKE